MNGAGGFSMMFRKTGMRHPRHEYDGYNYGWLSRQEFVSAEYY